MKKLLFLSFVLAAFTAAAATRPNAMTTNLDTVKPTAGQIPAWGSGHWIYEAGPIPAIDSLSSTNGYWIYTVNASGNTNAFFVLTNTPAKTIPGGVGSTGVFTNDITVTGPMGSTIATFSSLFSGGPDQIFRITDNSAGDILLVTNNGNVAIPAGLLRVSGNIISTAGGVYTIGHMGTTGNNDLYIDRNASVSMSLSSAAFFPWQDNNLDLGTTSKAWKSLYVTSVAPDSNGIKHKRVTTGSIATASSALITVTWTTAFVDANYTVTVSVIDPTATSLALEVVHVESVTAAAVTVRVKNTSAGALTGTLNVIALHD